MPTEITLTRKTQASKLDGLLKDDGLWQVLYELEAYLKTQDLRRLTAADVLAFLKPRHGDATLTMNEIVYVPYFDQIHMTWRFMCVSDGKISIPDGTDQDTIIVGIKVSASYE